MVSPKRDDFTNTNYLYDFCSKDSKVGKEFFDYVHIFQECMQEFKYPFKSNTSESLSGLYWNLAIFRNDKKNQLDSTADKIVRKFMDQVETCLEELAPTSSPELKKTSSKKSSNETTSIESSSMKSERGSLSSPASSSIKSDRGSLSQENEIIDDEIDTYECFFQNCVGEYNDYLNLVEDPSITKKVLEKSLSDLEESFEKMDAILESLNENERQKISFNDRFAELFSKVKALKLTNEHYYKTKKLNNIAKDFDICLEKYNKYVKELEENPDVEVVVYTSRFQKLKIKIDEMLNEINKLSVEDQKKINFIKKLKFMKEQSDKYINALKPVKPSVEKGQILPFSIPKTELVFYKLGQDPEIFQKNMEEIDELFEKFDELKDHEIVPDMLDVLIEMEARVVQLKEFFRVYDTTTELAKEKNFDEYQKDAEKLIPEFHTHLKAHLAMVRDHFKPSKNAKDVLPQKEAQPAQIQNSVMNDWANIIKEELLYFTIQQMPAFSDEEGGMPENYEELKDIYGNEVLLLDLINKICPHWDHLSPQERGSKVDELLKRNKG